MAQAEIKAEARHIARCALYGQIYCWDARKPEMTFREMLSTYHRWYRAAMRLMERYGTNAELDISAR